MAQLVSDDIEGVSAPAPAWRGKPVKSSFDTSGNDFTTLLHDSDPLKVELNRLESEVRDKDRELREARAEIKALRLSEKQRDKSIEVLTDEIGKMEEKLKLRETLLKSKDLEIEKISEDTKQKEAALVDAERRVVEAAQEKAAMVVDLQSKNRELIKQIEICQAQFQLWLKLFEGPSRGASSGSSRKTTSREGSRNMNSGLSRRHSFDRSDQTQKYASNGFSSKKNPAPASQLRHSLSSNFTSVILNSGKGTSRSFDGGPRSSWERGKSLLTGPGNFSFNKISDDVKESGSPRVNPEEKPLENTVAASSEDSTVPVVLYELLQEIIVWKKACQEKGQSFRDKDDVIEKLGKKAETLTKAMEDEAKKMRREVGAMEKVVAAMRVEKDQEICTSKSI